MALRAAGVTGLIAAVLGGLAAEAQDLHITLAITAAPLAAAMARHVVAPLACISSITGLKARAIWTSLFACAGAIAHCVCDSSKNLDIIIGFIKAGAAILRAFEESEGSA